MPAAPPETQAILFDLDGTLLDTARDLAAVTNRLRARLELPPLPYEEIRAHVSEGARALVSLACQCNTKDPRFPPLLQEFLEDYASSLAQQSRPFLGIPPLLHHLTKAQLPWGIVTNKARRFSEPLLAAMTTLPPPEVLVCGDDVPQGKPHPESLQKACRTLGADPKKTLYIGDHRRDILAGQRAGANTVAVAYGYRSPQDDPLSWGATWCVHDVPQLAELLGARAPSN